LHKLVHHLYLKNAELLVLSILEKSFENCINYGILPPFLFLCHSDQLLCPSCSTNLLSETKQIPNGGSTLFPMYQ
jgi:hypothetical protein